MTRTPLLIAGLAVLLAACGSDSPTGSTGPTSDAVLDQDVANFSADAVAEDIDLMTGLTGTIGNLSAPLATPGSVEGCGLLGVRIHCPPRIQEGLTITRDVQFFDATGASQTAYDPDLTASINIDVTVTGDITRGNWSASIDRHRNITLTGLAGQETTRTVNGTGHGTSSRVHVNEAGESRSYDLVGDATIANVVLPVRSQGGDPWPLSGTVTRTWTITATDGPRAGTSWTRTVTITFNGTDQATAVTGDGTTFTIDLPNRFAVPHFQH